jgi:hypothetical protein
VDAFETPRNPTPPAKRSSPSSLARCSTTRRPLQAVRDTILDRTPLLQKIIGESSPQEILKQLTEIDEVEQRFTAVRGSGAR